MNCFSKSKTDTKPTMDPLARYYVLSPLAGEFRRQLSGAGGAFKGGDPTWAYQGQRTAGTSPLQSQAFGAAGGLGNQAAAYQNYGINMLNQAPNFDATKAYTASLWNSDIMPSVMEQFAAQGGAASGGAQKALMRAGQQTSLGLASQLAPMELQARQGAAAQLPALYNMGLSGLNTQQQLGMQQRGIEQERLTGLMNQFYESSPWAHPALQYAGGMMGTGQTLYQKPAGMGYSALMGPMQMMGQAMGSGLSSAMGGGGGMNMSDIRVKRDIEPIDDARAELARELESEHPDPYAIISLAAQVVAQEAS